MTTLNADFKSKLTLEDEGYKSGSENFNIPTPLRRTSKTHCVSSDENVSFDPATPCSTGVSQSHCKPLRCWLIFSSSDDEDTFAVDSPSSIVPLQNPVVFLQQPSSKCTLPICDDLDEEEEEEDFQFPWKMIIGVWKKFHTDIYAYMNTHYCMNYVHTHAHIWITHLHHTMTPWI